MLWELRRERATLEQIFRDLTTSGIALAPETDADETTASEAESPGEAADASFEDEAADDAGEEEGS